MPGKAASMLCCKSAPFWAGCWLQNTLDHKASPKGLCRRQEVVVPLGRCGVQLLLVLALAEHGVLSFTGVRRKALAGARLTPAHPGHWAGAVLRGNSMFGRWQRKLWHVDL